MNNQITNQISLDIQALSAIGEIEMPEEVHQVLATPTFVCPTDSPCL